MYVRWSALTPNLYHSSLVTDIDFLSLKLSTSPPIAPVLNVVDTEMTDACKMSLNLFAIKLILTFINCNILVDEVEGPVQGAVDILPNPSVIMTGSCLLQISVLNF